MERIRRRGQEHAPFARGYEVFVCRRDAFLKIRDDEGAIAPGTPFELLKVVSYVRDSDDAKYHYEFACAVCETDLHRVGAIVYAVERREPEPEHTKFASVCIGCAEGRSDDELKAIFVERAFIERWTLRYKD